MADNHSKEVRSRNMSHIRSTNSKPEETVRKILFSHGFRYRKNVRTLPGKPDIVLPKYKTVIFVNGCFWHQHGCKFTSRPKSNPEFWNAKFDNNIVRDIKTNWELSLQGFRVATVWECSIKYDFERTIERLKAFIVSDEETIEI